jgi:hypothetical protein
MHTWMWLVLLTLGLIKLPIAALMLWIPFRSDAALESLEPAEAARADSSDEDDGGSKTLPDAGRGPRVGGGPRMGRGPRVGGCPFNGSGSHRGPHGGTAGGRVTSPARVRTSRRGPTRIKTRQ